ncbi:MAG TPA: tRNA (N(6)-L-threonylcarbamoyladenosine(37)-C(2))-methylthiotransferase MtaB [Acidobacteriota bacterium]|nr:tRNA (N(6)-L-threonylcarbamoyladenosine(37)-C(2))-methylthiotransferase MtaB [Acidobacteriota bacterium]
MNRSFQLHFFGCKTNQADALSVAGLFQRAGWQQTESSNDASLMIVQSCTVTMSADAQARQLIRGLKRKSPGSRILLTGCYAQRAEEELKKIPEVDYVAGNLNPAKMQILSSIAGRNFLSEDADFPMPAESGRTRQYIKIQDGCDARCSYCIIPAVRGKSRSLPPEEVIRRIQKYQELGYREVILSGISMGGYGKDLTPRTSLAELMQRIIKLSGNIKVRLSSLEPEEIHQEFIDVFTSSDKFQPHLHLPLQSASDQVLKKMRRQYLFRHFDTIVRSLFEKLPQLNLGTDLLVGFPEEDSRSFEETKTYFNDAPFAYAHIFPYSPRPSTVAVEYKAVASESEIHNRAAELREISRKKNREYRMQFLGRPLRSLHLKGTAEALTDNYIKVRLTNPEHLSDVVSVRIDEVLEDRTIGSVL